MDDKNKLSILTFKSLNFKPRMFTNYGINIFGFGDIRTIHVFAAPYSAVSSDKQFSTIKMPWKPYFNHLLPTNC
jgi:hypothetical protein